MNKFMTFFAAALALCTIGRPKVHAQRKAKANILRAMLNFLLIMNRPMKFFVAALLICSMSILTARAQYEVKANSRIGILFEWIDLTAGFGITYEHLFSEHTGGSVSLEYFKYSPLFDLFLTYKSYDDRFIGLSLTPEIRHYFCSRNKVTRLFNYYNTGSYATSFFIGAYLSYRHTRESGMLIYNDGGGFILGGSNDTLGYVREITNGIGFGITFGYKIITSTGFVLDFSIAGGYCALINSFTALNGDRFEEEIDTFFYGEGAELFRLISVSMGKRF